MESFLIKWTGLARRTSWLGVVAFFIATALCGIYSATHLKINTDTTSMLNSKFEFQQRALALRSAFPSIKNDIVIIVRAPSNDEADAFTNRLVSQLDKQEKLLQATFAAEIDPFFLQNGLLYLGTPELESRLSQLSKASGLIETLVTSPTLGTFYSTLAENDALAEKSDLGRSALDDIYSELSLVISSTLDGSQRPFSWLGALDPEGVPEEGVQRYIYATPALDYTRLQPAKPSIEAIDNAIENLLPAFGDRVEVFITGDPALRADELRSVSTGIGLSFALSFAMVALLLLIAYRSLALSIMTLLALIITIIFTSGFATFIFGELNLISVAFTVLLVGLGLDFAIHLLLHMQEHRRNGENRAVALKGSVHEVGIALAIAAPTTAIGFFAFAPTKFDGIAQLGIVAGVGVFIAFFVSITFLPAALGAMGAGERGTPIERKKRNKFLHLLRKPLTAITILAGFFAAFFIPEARFDADPMALRDPESRSVIGFNTLFRTKDTTPYRMTRLATSKEQVLETTTKAKSLASVSSVRSLLDFIPENQDEKLDLIDIGSGSLVFALDAEEDKSKSPSTENGAKKLIEQLKKPPETTIRQNLANLLEQSLSANPQSQDIIDKNIFAYWPGLVNRLRSQISPDYIDKSSLPEPLLTRYLAIDAETGAETWRVDILPAEDPRQIEALEKFVDDVAIAFPDIGGGAMQMLKAGEVISGAMLQATMTAFVLIAIFLWILLRRLTEVIMILFPLGLAATLTISTGIIFDIPFNYANVIVLPLLLGIGVDSGIHLVMRQRQVTAGEDLYGTSTPRAVFFSAITTVASFGSLMLSPHRGTASMGQLLSISIMFTLICTLVVLPTLLDMAARKKTP